MAAKPNFEISENRMEKLPITKEEIDFILSKFDLEKEKVTDFIDSSHSEDDIRWNFILDKRFVLKVNSPNGMWEERLQEISRLVTRYRSVGVYCPAYLPARSGLLTYTWLHKDKTYTCFVEEYARYPVCESDIEIDRKGIVEHLGVLAAKYTDYDLSETHSMWSIIDLSPFDMDVDEKQENADALAKSLRENGYPELAEDVSKYNSKLRAAILPRFRELPRCVFQGDLNQSNELHENGRFVGLIDFNCSGTDVNINVFLNETNWFPDKKEFEEMTISEMLGQIDSKQQDLASVIFKHYTMSALEKQLYPYFKRIVDLFQYPNVCAMAEWLSDGKHRERCAELIKALINRPL